MGSIIAWVAAVAWLCQAAGAANFLPRVAAPRSGLISDFNWHSIMPSRKLEYHSCYGKRLKCARLEVPLDWRAPENMRYDKTASIAIIKLPAKVPVTHHTYGGPLFVNPGGPGGSGIDLVTYNGQFLQYTADTRNEKYFDIVSFDPRGIGHTRPAANCFSDQTQRDFWNSLETDEGLLSEGDRVVNYKWARAQALGSACKVEHVGKYISTAIVARDMLELVDKENENRQKVLSEMHTGIEVVSKPKDHKTKAKLQYIGFSYGTMLGNTFASLYPDRVGRMVLDGVVDADDYIAQGWKRNVIDTDQLLKRMYKYCFEAGQEGCKIYNKGGPNAIENDINALLEALKQDPLPVYNIHDTYGPPTITTYAEVKTLMFQGLYSPVDQFVDVVNYLAQLRNGNTSRSHHFFSPGISCNTHLPFSPENEALQATACGDGRPQNQETKSDFKTYLATLESQSSLAGATWAEIRLSCTAWQTRPAWRYSGPFTGATSTPILWLSSTLDPVTPLENAFKMAKLRKGSVVLQQLSEGHTALFDYPSNCTLQAVKEYLSSAKLPKSGLKCPATKHAFETKQSRHGGTADEAFFDEHYGGQLSPPSWSVGRRRSQ